MDYHALLDLAVELGYRLAINGAETYRIEESVSRTLSAYGVKAEVFAIPNCLHVSIETPDGTPLTRMCRIGQHGNNLDTMETYSNISRKVCAEKPELAVWSQWMDRAKTASRSYNLPLQVLGGFLVGCGFCPFFGGYGFNDIIWAGICGAVICLVNGFFGKIKVNPFFTTIVSAFAMAIVAYSAASFSFVTRPDSVVVSALMILVPGMLFTNALRDIIFGDTNSGINRIVQVFLVASAIALGTGAALKMFSELWGVAVQAGYWTTAEVVIACFVGCIGLLFLFNIHGWGGLLCAIGGGLTLLVYEIVLSLTQDNLLSYFPAIVFAALYAEIMARIRKYPATAYLVVSVFPLLPGAGIYYTMRWLVQGNANLALQTGGETLAIAGTLAVGILMVSTLFRFISLNKKRK